jgi:hypothetical protein
VQRVPRTRITSRRQDVEEQRQERPIHRKERHTVADPTPLSDAERARLEQRRDRLMKLMNDGGGDMDADDRADLVQEWNKLDNLLQRK